MPKRKLKAALDKYQGVDHKLEKQRKSQKQAEKRKRQKLDSTSEAREDSSASALKEAERLAQTEQRLAEEALAADAAELLEAENGGEVGGWETDESEAADEQEQGGIDLAALDDESDSESDEDEIVQNDPNGMEEDGADIPLSDIESLPSDEKEDVIPHQRLTINNTAALQRSLKSFALPSSLPFSAVQSVTSTEPVQIADVEDDLNRELAFYKQSLDAVKEARQRLKKEGVPFSRPPDYFAEMVKSEEQMGKVRQKMIDEAARKKASADARRQRDLKKFGKAVQVAKLQERDKAKRDTMDKINVLKRSKTNSFPTGSLAFADSTLTERQGADLNANEDDMFDVALQDAAETEKADRAARRKGGDAAPNRKRQKKDEKFGFGGKKRFAKSNDAKSAGDERGYSARKMKGKPQKQRPGKSRRAAKTR